MKIVGTAVEAAAVGHEPAHAATASRDDATGLVGLLYSGLTGRWPLGNAGFPPAPRGEGGAPVPPADLVRGIPNDLDTLCVVTLSGSDDGPRSPAELAKELAPWPSAEEAPLRAAPRRLPTDPPPAPLGADSPLKIRSRPATKRGAGSKPARSQSTPPPAAGEAAASGSAGAAAAAGAAGAKPGTTPRRSATMFPTSVALTGSLPIPKEPPTGGPRRMDSLFTPQQPVDQGNSTPNAPAAGSEPGATTPNQAADPPRPPAWPGSPPFRLTPPVRVVPPIKPTPSAATAPAATPTRPAAGPPSTIKATPEANPAARSKPASKSGKESVSKAAPVAAKPAGKAKSASGPGSRDGGSPPSQPLMPWDAAWSRASEPPSGPDTSPFPIVIPAETPPREQSRLVIFSIAVVLVLGLGVAAFSLRDLGSSDVNVLPVETGSTLPTSTVDALAPTETAPTDVATTPTDVTSPTPTPTATKAAPVSIGSIRAIDPGGDGDEDTAASPLAVDGDESTFWKSQIYRSASFGGLKDGVGLALRLKRSAILTSATIDVSGTGGVVEVRSADSADVSSSKLLGTGTIKGGRVTVEAKGAKSAKYVILWFTKLPSVGGAYKIEVSEVRLK